METELTHYDTEIHTKNEPKFFLRLTPHFLYGSSSATIDLFTRDYKLCFLNGILVLVG